MTSMWNQWIEEDPTQSWAGTLSYNVITAWDDPQLVHLVIMDHMARVDAGVP